MLYSLLLPDLHVESVYEIDLDALKKRGVKGIITDLDNTLIEWNRPDATPQLLKWMKELKERGFSVVIVSNNKGPVYRKLRNPSVSPSFTRRRNRQHRPSRRQRAAWACGWMKRSLSAINCSPMFWAENGWVFIRFSLCLLPRVMAFLHGSTGRWNASHLIG